MRVLLHAPVDLNLIDGSTIWCISVAQTLCQDSSVQVDLMLNAPLQRAVNTTSLSDTPKICLLDPWKPRDVAALRNVGDKLAKRMTPDQAFTRITRLHDAQPYDLLVLRGGPICRLVAGTPKLAARSWFYLTQGGADAETCEAVARSNGLIACQTPLLQEYLEDVFGTAPSRYVPLPPLVPRLSRSEPRATRSGYKLCYVGKFDAHYRIEEQIAALTEIRKQFPDTTLVVAGDKFHDPEGTGDFERRLRAAFENTPGVDWRGALSREAVADLMNECDLGCCWRTAHYDDSLELSTKALEYAAAGLPVLLNPSRINRLVFGDDYPLYVDTPESFVTRVCEAWEHERVYQTAASQMIATAGRFTFSAARQVLERWLATYRPDAPAVIEPDRPQRIVFAGHDLKFAREIITHFSNRPDCVVRIENWLSHTRHDERRSEELLRWADVVYCEWCLGNAVWYSQRLRPAQRMVIRLHRQERDTQFPNQVAWDNVDHLLFIAPQVRDEITAQLDQQLTATTHLLLNVIDCDRFDRTKPEACSHTLGMLGYSPRLKQPRLALDILARLMERDDRWRLHLGGKDPREYEWLWRRPTERAYYEAFEEQLAAGLEQYVVREGWTDDPGSWYAPVGYLLSCSDFEGSHQAIPEGMAAGCVPIVRRWDGAADLYPRSCLFESVDEAVEHIQRVHDSGTRDELGDQARVEARQRFDQTVILSQFEPLLLGPSVSRFSPESATTGAASAGRRGG